MKNGDYSGLRFHLIALNPLFRHHRDDVWNLSFVFGHLADEPLNHVTLGTPGLAVAITNVQSISACVGVRAKSTSHENGAACLAVPLRVGRIVLAPKNYEAIGEVSVQ